MINVLQSTWNLDQNSLHASERQCAPPSELSFTFLFFSVSCLPRSVDVRMPSFLSHHWIPVLWWVNDVTVEALLKCFAPISVGRTIVSAIWNSSLQYKLLLLYPVYYLLYHYTYIIISVELRWTYQNLKCYCFSCAMAFWNEANGWKKIFVIEGKQSKFRKVNLEKRS